jgi:hypothetical protein
MGGVHKQLQLGQTVSLADQPTGFQVTVLAAEQPGQKIVEIGDDYLIFDDETAGITTRVPVHLIHSVTFGTPVEQPQAA